MNIKARALSRLSVLALLVLAACSGNEEYTVLTCPQVFLIKDATHYATFAPGVGRDLVDVRYNADIEQIEWLCTFYTDENRVAMEVRFGMLAEKGSAAEDSYHRFPYFVAVADPSGTVVAKQVFGIDIDFPGNVLQVGHIESVFQRLNYSVLSEASKYTVYIGFQLSREQLAEARAAAGM